MITTVTIALALAPETGGLSLIVAAAALVYGFTRGGVQTAAGAAELLTAAAGDKEAVKSVSEGMEQVKTLVSVSGFLLLSVQEVRHRRLTEADWRHAGFLSDAETLITSRRADKAYEVAAEAVRVSRRIALVKKLGGYADTADQYKSYGKDIVSGAHWAMEYRAQQERDREKKTRQLAPTTKTSVAQPASRP